MASVTKRSVLLGAAGAGAAAILPLRSARSAGEPIRIGFITALSGPLEINGRPGLLGGQFAQEQFNKAGGIGGRQVELVVRDDRGDPAQAIAAMRELAGNGINLIIAGTFTATAMALAPIAPDLKVVFMVAGSPADPLTHELFSRNLFEVPDNSYIRNTAYAKFLADQYGDIDTWACIGWDLAIQDDVWRQLLGGMKKFYVANGKPEPKILDPIKMKFGTSDFRLQLSNMMASPAKGLYSGLFGAEAITFFQQARSFGVDEKFAVICDQANDFNLARALGANMFKDLISISFWYAGAYPDNTDALGLVRYFQDKTGNPIPHGFSSLGHTAVKALGTAVAASGSTETDPVINTLEGMRFETVKGPAVFRKQDHQLLSEVNIIRFGKSPSPPGWMVKDCAKIGAAAIANPPTPGVRSTL